tara:strand:- start:32 stop:436 length:405 start_codon:yes stop_codon:yes gene_type:complete
MLISIRSKQEYCFNIDDYFNENKYIDLEYIFENSYIKRIKILRFFSEKSNFNRLKVILDKKNNIVEKIINLIESNDKVCNEYNEIKNNYIYDYFIIDPNIKYNIEINDTIFNTSVGQLNVLAWLIHNDYLLYIN